MNDNFITPAQDITYNDTEQKIPGRRHRGRHVHPRGSTSRIHSRPGDRQTGCGTGMRGPGRRHGSCLPGLKGCRRDNCGDSAHLPQRGCQPLRGHSNSNKHGPCQERHRSQFIRHPGSSGRRIRNPLRDRPGPENGKNRSVTCGRMGY